MWFSDNIGTNNIYLKSLLPKFLLRMYFMSRMIEGISFQQMKELFLLKIYNLEYAIAKLDHSSYHMGF